MFLSVQLRHCLPGISVRRYPHKTAPLLLTVYHNPCSFASRNINSSVGGARLYFISTCGSIFFSGSKYFFALQVDRATEIKTSAKPLTNHIVGERVVLDALETYKNPDARLDPAIFKGEFFVDKIDDEYITVSNSKTKLQLTCEEIAKYTVQPIADRVHREHGTDYYLIRYPDGIDAGAALRDDDLALITEKARQVLERERAVSRHRAGRPSIKS
jgi:hypothetical protein